MILRNRLSRRAAFVVALIGTPGLIGAVGGLLAAIGTVLDSGPFNVAGLFLLMSVAFGGLSYLFVGGYFFWRAIRRGERRVSRYALAGFLANLVAGVLTVILAAVAFTVFGGGVASGEWIGIPLIIHAFGLIFAPAYGLIFGALFTWLAEDRPPETQAWEDVEAVFR